MSKKSSLVLDKNLLAYITGIALGDGNLSNPNGRATRLRITCDLKYPQLIQKIQTAINTLLPTNKVSLVRYQDKGKCLDISCYSNYWENLLGWCVSKGSKLNQNVSIPDWIKRNHKYSINCLQGLIETDGSVYEDRGYKTMMFTSAIPNLAKDFYNLMLSLEFKPRFYVIRRTDRHPIFRIRLATDVEKFLQLVKPEKF